MALSPYKEILAYAKEHHITIGAFNSYNMESVQALVAAAEKQDVPLIVQTYHAHMDYAGADYMQAICAVAAKKARVKIALGLDHGKTFEQAAHCIEVGYSGVMIDLASEDLEYNIAETKKVVAAARPKNVSVEAEIGKIFDADRPLEEIATGYTDPQMAKRFVEETGVDCLAVSIGTAHGHYAHTPKVNFDLLEEIIRVVPCPIVVHGGSYTPDEEILKMVKMGISKLNIGTEFFDAWKKTVHDILAQNMKMEIIDVLAEARKAVEAVASKKLDLLNAYRV